MSRSRGPNGHMRYECDDCDTRTSEPEGTSPAGWRVEFALDLCPPCDEAAARGEAGRWERRLESLAGEARPRQAHGPEGA